MRAFTLAAGAAVLLTFAVGASADIIVNYTNDAGGNNPNPLNGLSASADFTVVGSTFTIALTNTSAGAPLGADISDSLLVSLGFNLPGGVMIVSGDTAVIGAGSVGLGGWSGLLAGDSVADEWLWTNDFGGDLLNGGESLGRSQIISTSNGQGGGTETLFGGGSGNVSGPFGGIAADLPAVPMNPNQEAVSDTIVFTLMLSNTISQAQLQMLADESVVEFGSDFQYLAVPTPAVAPLLLLGFAGVIGRKRREG